MEKVMSVEDKIRKAEEIYYRRKNQEIPNRENIIKPVKQKKNIKLFKKMIKQIIICLLLYLIFYLIINNNYIFSEDFTQKVKEILSQDINFSQIYYSIINAEELPTVQQQNVESTEIEVVEEVETVPILSQMEQDANHIKTTINFIKPVNGTISSMFGLRNPTTSTVPKNHTGTDIAATIGTPIISATSGTVVYSSEEGDYGKHLKIETNDVIILYAHCNKLYVKEGDIIEQGQEIAEVGATGNTTGPHLHFEIRYQERYIDPQLILDL